MRQGVTRLRQALTDDHLTQRIARGGLIMMR